jgi:hypothetical protein
MKKKAIKPKKIKRPKKDADGDMDKSPKGEKKGKAC